MHSGFKQTEQGFRVRKIFFGDTNIGQSLAKAADAGEIELGQFGGIALDNLAELLAFNDEFLKERKAPQAIFLREISDLRGDGIVDKSLVRYQKTFRDTFHAFENDGSQMENALPRSAGLLACFRDQAKRPVCRVRRWL